MKSLIRVCKTLFLVVFIFYGCTKDDSVPEENVLVANAGEDQSIEIMTKVALDGSASNASNGGDFDYSWEFTNTPPSSTVALTGATIVSPSFTPDVAGDYIVKLTISDGTSESTDSVKITVTEVDPNTVIELGGTIREDIVLVNRVDTPGVADYCVTSNIDLKAIMTIEPGVEIHFDADLSFVVEDEGILIAEGTEDNRIVFTAKNQETPWRGIMFFLSEDVRNTMDFVDISYAGVDKISIVDRKAALALSTSSVLSFTNSRITNSSGIGMYLYSSNVKLTSFSNNSFSNNADVPLVLPAAQVGKLDAASKFSVSNGENVIEINDGDLDLDGPTTWTSFEDDTPYHISDNIQIDSELIILPGATFMFDPDLSCELNDGILIAKGTAEKPIVFTAKDQNIPWRGIGVVLSDSFRNVMDYVEISYAGADKISIIDRKAALGVSSFSTLSFTNSTITNSVGYGMFVEDDVDLKTFENNTFQDNAMTPLVISGHSLHQLDVMSSFGNTNGSDYVEITNATVDNDNEVTWKAFEDGTPYMVSGNLRIDSGITIAPKAKFLMKSDLEIIINSNAFLSAKGGSADGRIVFTAFDTSLPWRGIAFLTDDIRNEMDFTEVSYAGSDFVSILSQKGNVLVSNFDNLKITNSILSNGIGYGIVVDSDAQINTDAATSNTFDNNTLGTVFNEM